MPNKVNISPKHGVKISGRTLREVIVRHGLFIVVWLVSTISLWNRSGQGWIPHDEGLMAQTAERVLRGELPHRDFDDTYTGGIAMMHAAAFYVLGTDLYSMRVVLLLFGIAMIPAIYTIARQVASPPIAALATWTAIAWSLPNYFAPLPSWYNLFFAIFGTCALLRFIDTGRNRWLVLAGILAGFSILIKIVGIYFVAGSLLFLLFREQEVAHETISNPSSLGSGNRRRPGLYPFALSVAVGVFVAAVVILIRRRFTLMDAILFVVPSLALGTVLGFNEWRLGGYSSRTRWRNALINLAVFLIGISIPLAVFLVPYVATGSLLELYQGVLISPQKRLDLVSHALPAPSSLIALLPIALVLMIQLPRDSILNGRLFTTTAATGGSLAVFAGGIHSVYAGFWNSARPIVPLVVLIGCWQLIAKVSDGMSKIERQKLFVVLAMCTTISFVQFPYSYGIYFCYAAPMVVLAVIYVAARQRLAPKKLQFSLLLVYWMFGIIWLNHGYIRSIGLSYVRVANQTSMNLDRAQLTVPFFEANVYSRLVEEVQKHSKEKSFIYATSDCPEIYFLCNRRNPTRTMYDFFDIDFQSDPAGRIDRLIAMLDEKEIKVVVLHWTAEFSGAPAKELVAAIESQFTSSSHYRFFPQDDSQVHPDFSVVWRD